MELDELGKNWDQFGRDDPLWAVLTAADKREGGWDVDEFLKTGEEQVDSALEFLRTHGVDVPRQRALDFGCGPGRLTQALATRFDEVDGVDIAPSMIALARKWNRHGDRCRYHVNERSDLSLFADGTFSFIFTILVMQHMEARFQENYLREFGRCLAPGGFAFFQVVSERERVGTPLPEDGFRADVAFELPAEPIEAGGIANVPVTIRNAGAHTWLTTAKGGTGNVTVANRWLAEDGTVLVADDARAFLPHDLSAGADASVSLFVHAPAEPGRYRLQIDLVQEAVAWFQDKGSTPAAATVEVVQATHRADDHGGAPDAHMEMHTISLDDCTRALKAGGAKIAEVYPYEDVYGEPDPHFDSLIVLATKPARRLLRRRR